MLSNTWFVYILSSQRNGTLYVGSTNDLLGRVRVHRDLILPGFTKTYKVRRLMWFEVHDTMVAARYRERRIKAWKRQWKIDLFKDINPNWDDLYPARAAE